MLYLYAIRCVASLIAGALLLVSATAKGHANPCNAAADVAAARTGVPLSVLKAITLAETGRHSQAGQFAPWPWAVQSRGLGQWFDTQREAESYVRSLLEAGEDNIDIGCFQLNMRWHGNNFSSLQQMFNANSNASYAAEFLLSFYSETGSWRAATGAYHSRYSTRSEAYLTRLEALYATHLAPDQPPTPTALPQRKAFSLRGSVAPLIIRHRKPTALIGSYP